MVRRRSSSCARRLASSLTRLSHLPLAPPATQSSVSKSAKEGRLREFVEITGAT